MKDSPWHSVKQFAKRYGYHPSTIRRWLRDFEADTKISDEVRRAAIYGAGKTRRIHAEHFGAWLRSKNQPAAGSGATVLIVHEAQGMQ